MPTFKMSPVFEGSIKEKLKKLVKAQQSVKGYDVGFIKSRYSRAKNSKQSTTPNSTKTEVKENSVSGGQKKNRKNTQKGSKSNRPVLVAQVAIWNEFGTKNIPERPFFRTANKTVEKKLIKMIAKDLNEKDNYVLDETAVGRLGLVHEIEVKESIRKWSKPENSASTIRIKGFDDPLIDTRLMRDSVVSKVIKK